MREVTNLSNIEVLYEDNHLIAINKRPGDIVQGDKTGDPPLSDILKAYLKKKYNKPGNVFLGVIHRIDRPVSGVVVFAKTSKALARMNAKLQEKSFRKTYWAIIESQPQQKEGNLKSYLIKNQEKNKSFASDLPKKGYKFSELDYRLIRKSDRYFLLEIDPKTGRHHQIRVQLSNIGCPIKGDVKYGSKRTNKDASISLHAQKVVFEHPTLKEKTTITAPPPHDKLWDFFVS
jgi:23S rRNA pseudouridine1911/1915/1917 synthase